MVGNLCCAGAAVRARQQNHMKRLYDAWGRRKRKTTFCAVAIGDAREVSAEGNISKAKLLCQYLICADGMSRVNKPLEATKICMH